MNSDAIKDGGSAHPFSFTIPGGMRNPFTGNDVPEGRETFHCSTGMSMRDHFAGLAMQAAAINPDGANGFTFSERAQWAYEQADAMIRAREA